MKLASQADRLSVDSVHKLGDPLGHHDLVFLSIGSYIACLSHFYSKCLLSSGGGLKQQFRLPSLLALLLGVKHPVIITLGESYTSSGCGLRHPAIIELFPPCS